MNNRLKIFGLILITFLITESLYAQETFIPDINYQYLDNLIAVAKRNYPEVKLRQSQVKIAQGTLSYSKALWLDAFTATYIYNPQNTLNVVTPSIFNGYQLGVSVNIGQLFSKPYTVRNAREGINIAKFQQSEYLLSLEANVKRYYFAYLEAQAELRLRSAAVVDGSTATKQLKYAFQKNETTFQIYNESLVLLYNQNSFKIQAELNMMTAKTNLEELIGIKLEDVK